MAAAVDHYQVLGLPTGEEGAKLSDKEIHRAYKLKALKLHPDKRPDDPDAKQNFQKLQASYHVLIDTPLRRAHDDALRSQVKRKRQADTKRQEFYDDLVRREHAAAASWKKSQQQHEKDKFSQQQEEEKSPPYEPQTYGFETEEERLEREHRQDMAAVRAKLAAKETLFTPTQAEAIFYAWNRRYGKCQS